MFAQHVNSPSSLFALKFFLQEEVFAVEKAAACNDVRSWILRMYWFHPYPRE